MVGYSRLNSLEFKEPIVLGDKRSMILRSRTLQNNARTWNRASIHIEDCADNGCGRRRRRQILLRQCDRCCHTQTTIVERYLGISSVTKSVLAKTSFT